LGRKKSLKHGLSKGKKLFGEGERNKRRLAAEKEK